MQLACNLPYVIRDSSWSMVYLLGVDFVILQIPRGRNIVISTVFIKGKCKPEVTFKMVMGDGYLCHQLDA